MFDPRDPYERYWWHYDSRRQLSTAQIIALDSVDAKTVAMVWLLLEHGDLRAAGVRDPGGRAAVLRRGHVQAARRPAGRRDDGTRRRAVPGGHGRRDPRAAQALRGR